MRLPEMLVNGLERFIPINKQDLAILKGELTNKYFDYLNSIQMKNDKNAPVQAEIDKLEEEINKLDPHSPEFEEKLNTIDRMTSKLLKPSIVEQIVNYLEKPLVRVVLMVGFLIFSRWLFSKLTEKPKEQDPEQVEEPEQAFNQGYNPYGSAPNGFWAPNGQFFPNQQQPQNFGQNRR